MKKDLALPWKVVTPQEKGKDAQISTVDGFHIASINRFAERFGNKQHIKTAHGVVRAVNNFDALLEALKITANYYHETNHDAELKIEHCKADICIDNLKTISNAEK